VVEALPTQFEGHLLWVHLHLHLLWVHLNLHLLLVQGAVEEAVRVGEMLLANSLPQLISTCRTGPQAINSLRVVGLFHNNIHR